MKIQDQAAKDRLIQRLRRVEGQLRGVQAMLAEERDCKEIMQQLTAVNSAVQSASRTFFRDYAALCLTEMDDQAQPASSAHQQAKREQLVADMVALLAKTP